MIAILTLLLAIGVSMLIIKVAAVALAQTGMTRDMARFQARSAFTGVGFTTTASEKVVGHPLRRRIITILIIMGNAGLATVIGSLIIGFNRENSALRGTQNLIILLLGVTLLFLLSRSILVDRLLERSIRRILRKKTTLGRRGYHRLVELAFDYEITEVDSKENSWLCDKTLAELNLPDEGVLVLGIWRNADTYLGAPRGDYTIQEGDRVVMYGKGESLGEIARVRDNLEGKELQQHRKEQHSEEMEEQDEQAGET